MSIIKEDDSPPQQINEQSLTQNLEKTRESLKRKLQTRRSLQQLVDVGIIPSPKSSLSSYDQNKKLQMRKTQDILKNKILSRPNRQLLIEHNILSDTTAAPAIQKTQCQLKRARLVDNLNDKISLRPGILELVANNIVEIDSNLKQDIQKTKRPLLKSKSCLTFHEYKGPLQKVEVTKVPFQSILKPIEDNYYRNQLKQQQVFLELIQNEDKTMKLADLKNECKELNICSTETKIKLTEKLKNAQKTINNKSSLNDEEQSEKLKQDTIVPLTSESVSQPTNVLDDNISSLTYMDWMPMPSPIIIDNNSDLTQFDIDYHLLFDSTYQQQNTLSFDLFSLDM